MLVVVAGLVVFRSPDVATALTMLVAMVDIGSSGHGWLSASTAANLYYADAVALITILGGIALMLPNTQQVLYRFNISSDPTDYDDVALRRWLLWRPSFRWAVQCAVVCVCALGFATGETAFIYYQF